MVCELYLSKGIFKKENYERGKFLLNNTSLKLFFVFFLLWQYHLMEIP